MLSLRFAPKPGSNYFYPHLLFQILDFEIKLANFPASFRHRCFSVPVVFQVFVAARIGRSSEYDVIAILFWRQRMWYQYDFGDWECFNRMPCDRFWSFYSKTNMSFQRVWSIVAREEKFLRIMVAPGGIGIGILEFKYSNLIYPNNTLSFHVIAMFAT